MANTVILTKTGEEKLLNAFTQNTSVKIQTFKVSDADVQLNENMTDIPNAWYQGDIDSVVALDDNTLQFTARVPIDKSEKYGRLVGLFDDAGDLILVAKYEDPLPPLAEQVYRIIYRHGRFSNLVELYTNEFSEEAFNALLLDFKAEIGIAFINLEQKLEKLFQTARKLWESTKTNALKHEKLFESVDDLKQECEEMKENVEETQAAIIDLYVTHSEKILEHSEQLQKHKTILEILQKKTSSIFTDVEELEELTHTMDKELRFIDYITYQLQTEYIRQLLSTGILSTSYGNRNPNIDIIQTSLADISFSALGIHNHANYRAMPGMGWWVANANGFLFQTKHNDYVMYKKGTGDTLELNLAPSIDNSISVQQMQDLFNRYLKGQLSDKEKQYFRWDLAYAEVFILQLDGPFEQIADQYENFKHTLGVITVNKLLAQLLVSRITGIKTRFENLELLPIFQLPNGKYGLLVYRILTHPIELYNGKHWNEILEPYDAYEINDVDFYSVRKRFRLKNIDEVIQVIPGLDGEGASITKLTTIDGKTTIAGGRNYAYYGRLFTYTGNDAVGITTYQYGWNDRTLFVAHTKHPNVYAGVSYLIPLEMILRTPLENWNPLNIPYVKDIQQITGDGTSGNPYNGWNERGYYYLTPSSFYENIQQSETPADTRNQAYIKDSQGNTQLCVASGIWINLPKIANVDQVIRIRFPVYYNAVEEGLIGYFIQIAKYQSILTITDTSVDIGRWIMKLTSDMSNLKFLLRKGLLSNITTTFSGFSTDDINNAG